MKRWPNRDRDTCIASSSRSATGPFPASTPTVRDTRIRELLTSFFASQGIGSTIEQCLLPDDATLLRREVLGGREKGVDLIITTGSTGVGPRDIAPRHHRGVVRQADPRHHGTYPHQVWGEQPAGPPQPRDRRRGRNDANLHVARKPAGRRRVHAGNPRHVRTCR